MTVAARRPKTEEFSSAELHVELAKLALQIMREPAGLDSQTTDSAAYRLVAQFEQAAAEVLKRTAAIDRDYAERRIGEMVQSSPVYRALQASIDSRSLCMSARVDPAGVVNVQSVGSGPQAG